MTEIMTESLSVSDVLPWAIEMREHLHRYPELSMQEYETAKFISDQMLQMGFQVAECSPTGLVCTLARGQGPLVIFRADMDGLPVKENTGLSFSSSEMGHLTSGEEVPVMHACGHDIHMATALGTAKMLASNTSWKGTVVFLFQPGEETGEGAKAMIDGGLAELLPAKPSVILGFHVWPLPAGDVEIIDGPTMAAGDSYTVRITGTGGHGSQPHNTVDPVLVAAQTIVALQTVISRTLDPQLPGVLTVGTINGGLKENIIPDKVEFSMNIRSTNASSRETILNRTFTIVKETARAFGARASIDPINSFPALISDSASAARLYDALSKTTDKYNVYSGSGKLASEDFGLLGEALNAPSVYWFVGGTARQKYDEGDVPTNHSAEFAPLSMPTLQAAIASAYHGCLEFLG